MKDKTQFILLDAALCALFLAIPLWLDLPYRVNIFLSWEGAYRLYLGQIPFKDFGLPMGFGYWVLPALFFKFLGPSFLSLIKAQVLLNVVSILSLRGILYNLNMKPLVVSLSILIFCLTYVIFQFWPWYNHSVVVFELASIYFLTRSLMGPHEKYRIVNLILSAFMAFFSLFTKQDVGAICFAICLALLIYHAVRTRRYRALAWFAGSYAVVALIVVLPFIQYDFLYWFNYGQPPHSARLSAGDILAVFFQNPSWEKIYLFLFVLVLALGGRAKYRSLLIFDPGAAMLVLITLGLLGQAIVTQVTSPLPGNITYFHAFGFAMLASLTPLRHWLDDMKNAMVMGVVVGLMFSAGYWKYLNGLLGLSDGRHTESTSAAISPAWVPAPFRSFDKVLMPRGTISGIARLLDSQVAKRKTLNVLNMSELTPLALEMNYTPPTNQPLWYHLNIGIFQKEVDTLCARVKRREYDLVLFEDIPNLTEFYPYQVRDTLRRYYRLQDNFLAPRQLENSTIEVYVKNK